MSEMKTPGPEVQQGRGDPARGALADVDPRVVQMLSTEHWSVLSARSLAYNEAFTRAGMFLSFLSMTTVALALLVQGVGFTRTLGYIALIVLAFDLLVGLTTYMRVAGANHDDLVALHAMSRIRHAYTEVSPGVERYFTAPTHDDVDSLMTHYPDAWNLGTFPYVLSTTLGMVGLIVCAISGVLASVIALLASASALVATIAGMVTAVVVLGLLAAGTFKAVNVNQGKLPALFPAVEEAAG